MKVAVYSISKNEEQFVSRWVESAKDADIIVLADTGSTDNTIQVALDHNINVHSIVVDPWRFDVARNKSLEFIPEDYDYCIALDVDEVLLPGWREHLENMHFQGVTRPRYKYVWSWNEDGSEGLTYYGDKIHTRQNYVWRHPVHEVLNCTSIEKQDTCGLEIHHHPDSSKSRSQYLPLLKMSVEEDPDDDRNAYYYARELYYYGEYDEAVEQFKRHLSLPRAVWRPERSRSMRYLAELLPLERECWLLRATAECPERREPWVDLAKYYYSVSRWEGCLWASQRALEVKDKPLEYLCEEFAWGAAPYDYAAIAAYNLGLFDKAVEFGSFAVSLAPNDSRLVNNLVYYNKEVSYGD